jgi:aconitate hydratase
MFQRTYADVFEGNPTWNAITGSEGDLYNWNPDSTYIQEPPFFINLALEPGGLRDIRGARVLALLGDSVTTDHISPAGDIAENSPAGRYLKEHGIEKRDFNTYGARRGNDRVLVRGTFANIRLKNLLLGGEEGGNTLYFGGQPEKMSIYDAAMKYKADGIPLVVIAGKEYGTGSSRDWAAKGPLLLGIRAALAESFERIHRSNLVGMGILPLQFQDGQTAESLGLTGHEIIDIEGIGDEDVSDEDVGDEIKPRQDVTVRATRPDGSQMTFAMTARLDTPVEVDYYRNGGILPTVLRRLVREA